MSRPALIFPVLLLVTLALPSRSRGSDGPCLSAWNERSEDHTEAFADAARRCVVEAPMSTAVQLDGGRWVSRSAPGERTLAVSPFALDRLEVRVRDFDRCIRSGVCRLDDFGDHGADRGCNFGAAGRGDHPMNCVEWEGAKRYCEWIGGRLPSEAELEWATSLDGASRYPWGWATPTCDHANFRQDGLEGCGHAGTLPGGSSPFGASPGGLVDLVGNVAEWAADGYLTELPDGVFQDPVHAGDPGRRAVRGGSWRDPIHSLGSRARSPRPLSARDPEVGFRCAYDAGTEPAAATLEPSRAEAPRVPPTRRVSAGSFPRGSRRGVGDSDEWPQRALIISDFDMAQLEVNVRDYRLCVLDAGCRSLSFRSYSDDPACNYGRPDYGQHPMNCVSWFGAQDYCHWLGGRLPTEAEWEKAARGVDSRSFPWGNQPSECYRANQNASGGFADMGCGTGGTLPVGTFYDGVSPYDLFDLAGNVQEWVIDWYAGDYYALSPEQDPIGPLTGASRVVRGGSYADHPDFLRSAYRFLFPPTAMTPTVGFRCVWPLDE